MDRMRGPWVLGGAWVLHDIEEALTFPAGVERASRALTATVGTPAWRMSPRQSWAAVGLMGVLVGTAVGRGVATQGRSALYRAVTAGLLAHVGTHVAASAAARGYTPGVATAVPIMGAGALYASRECAAHGEPLTRRDYARGAAVLIPAALVCHALARALFPERTELPHGGVVAQIQ